MIPVIILNKKKNDNTTKIINGKSYNEMLYRFGCIDSGVKRIVEVLAFSAAEARQKITNGSFHPVNF